MARSTLGFDGFEDFGAQCPDVVPVGQELFRLIDPGEPVPGLRKDGLSPSSVLPGAKQGKGFFGGEREDRGNPAQQGIGDLPQGRLR